MRRLCWSLVIISTLGVASSAPDDALRRVDGGQFEDLVFSPGVADNLALLFSQFDTELVLCLEGEHRGTRLYITDFRMPHILLSETGRVQAASCQSGSKTVGTWHNHPPAGLTLASSNPKALARNCYLSRTDINDFLKRSHALVTVVSCAPHTYAYWTRRDIDPSAADAALLPPPTGRLVQGQAANDSQASDLTQARRR